MIGKYWIETLARKSQWRWICPELRYRTPPLTPNGLAMFISQSGETMDTLEALRYCQGQGQRIISIVNVPESSIYRARCGTFDPCRTRNRRCLDQSLYYPACYLVCFAIALARKRKQLTLAEEQSLVAALLKFRQKPQKS